MGVGFVASATVAFAVLYLLSDAFGVERVPLAARQGTAAVVCVLLFLVDAWGVRRGRTCTLALPRQTSKRLYYSRGPRIGAFVWGLDTGLSVTTYRVSATTWAALGLTALHIAPVWTGISYGLGFALPIMAAILVPRWRPDAEDGTRREPRWIPRLLQRRVHVVQTGGLVAITATTALLTTALLGVTW
ncbi:MAG: hypothetical protein GEV03_08255 [Streptosporangiales bacterium]|nr:hypothetical protein [Streptosporangiales bacterium]